jgi:hypothetical protein
LALDLRRVVWHLHGLFLVRGGFFDLFHCFLSQ